MKKIWDKIFHKFRTNKRFIVFLFTLLFMGVLFGALFAVKLNSNDLQEIKTSLESFFKLLNQNKLNFLSTFFQSFSANVMFLIAIFFFGISVGIPLTIILFFMKAFTLGFTIASIIKIYHMKGLVYSFIYIFPHQVINILVYIFCIMFSISLSMTLVSALLKKKTVDFSLIMNRYIFVFIVAFVLLVFTSVIPILVFPRLTPVIFPSLSTFAIFSFLLSYEY